jgi:SagB-type dehydrogenase family enzyme
MSIILTVLLMVLLMTSCADIPQGKNISQDIGETQTMNDTAASATLPGREEIQLPSPRTMGELSLEEALFGRRSIRDFTPQELSLDQISQLLWAAQGITHPSGLRTAPSAGALYPLEIYVVTPQAVYLYRPLGHRLSLHKPGDQRRGLYESALRQEAVLEAPATVVLTAVFQRTIQKYGALRSPRYIYLEAGHAAQNVLLQAVAMGLGSVPIGAFQDARVKDVLSLPDDHEPVYLLPVGYPE